MNIGYCHIPGCENVIADSLSHFPLTQLDSAEPLEYHRGIDVCVRSNQEEEHVRSCRVGVLGQFKETYMVDGKTCHEDENMVTKLVIEKNDVRLLAKLKNLIGSS